MADTNWAEYEDAIGPPAGAAARVRARVDRVLAERGHVRDDAPRQEDRAPRAAAVILMVKSTALSVTIAVAALGMLHVGARVITPAELPRTTVATEVASPREPVVPVDAPASVLPVVAAAPPPVVVAPAPPPVAPIARVPEPRAAPAAPAAAPAAAPLAAPAADTLREETALVERARAAMGRKNPTAALTLLAEHARRFPAGGLVHEREAFTAIATCRAGKGDRAAIAAGFAAAHPGSTYLSRVRDACSDSPTESAMPPE